MVEKFDKNAWAKLVELAGKEISGESVSNKDVKKVLRTICSKLVYSEVFDIALEEVDSAVVMKIRSWLDWYAIHLELKSCHVPMILEKFTTAGQIVFLSGLFALVFLYDSATPSYIALDAKIVLTVYGFVCFAAASQILSIIVQEINIEIKVANLILSSINKICINPRERKK